MHNNTHLLYSKIYECIYTWISPTVFTETISYDEMQPEVIVQGEELFGLDLQLCAAVDKKIFELKCSSFALNQGKIS